MQAPARAQGPRGCRLLARSLPRKSLLALHLRGMPLPESKATSSFNTSQPPALALESELLHSVSIVQSRVPAHALSHLALLSATLALVAYAASNARQALLRKRNRSAEESKAIFFPPQPEPWTPPVHEDLSFSWRMGELEMEEEAQDP